MIHPTQNTIDKMEWNFKKFSSKPQEGWKKKQEAKKQRANRIPKNKMVDLSHHTSMISLNADGLSSPA